MKAAVFHGIGDIRIDTVSDPEVADVTDAVVRVTASAICGTDLHMVRGALGGMSHDAFDVREPDWMKVTLTPRRCEPDRGGL
jgi:threonine dehydrogenase-like Zn-dependent dehydrogenase